jgi:hypothetical protein
MIKEIMKPKLILILIFLGAFGLSACEDTYRGTLILNGSHQFREEDSLVGEMIIVRGAVSMDQGTELPGSIYMLGGELQMNGEIHRDLSLIGGQASLGPQAIVGGNLNVAGGSVEISPDARVIGALRESTELSLDAETLFPRRDPHNRLIWLLPQTLGIAILGYVITRFFPRQVARVGKAASEHPLIAGAVGLLCGLVLPALLVLMAFTVILIPVTIIGLIFMGLILVYGWIGAGSAVGNWLKFRIRKELSSKQTTFWGTLIFILALQILGFVPLIGPTLALIATLISTGAVLITRFGSYAFVPAIDPELPEVEI